MSAILCIDTASAGTALAFDVDGVVSSSATADEGHTRLLTAIAALIGSERLDAVLVVIGPGSYAGIRSGIATAEGLALAHEASIFGIGTLEAATLAAQPPPGGELTVIHPAGRGEFAARRFIDHQPAGPLAVVRPAELSRGLAGEGAGALGGIEVSPLQRCLAALASRAPAIRSGTLEQGAEAFYLREPSITVSRRLPAAP